MAHNGIRPWLAMAGRDGKKVERRLRRGETSDPNTRSAVGHPSGAIVIVADGFVANAELLGHLSREAHRYGFRPLIVPATADLSFAALSAAVPGVRGVIIASDLVDPAAFSGADRPVLLMSDHAREDLPFDQLVHDAEHAGNWAAEYIASAGRTSVAIAGTADPDHVVVRGFLKGVSTYDLVVRGDHIVRCLPDRRDAAAQFNAFLGRVSTLPQAVYCTSGDVACGVHEALHAAGFAVPSDMWIVGNGLSPMTGAPFYDITTIAPATEILAAEAIDLLRARIDSAGRRPQIRHVAYRTTPGTTTDFFSVVRSQT